jgi:hypothetical protein
MLYRALLLGASIGGVLIATAQQAPAIEWQRVAGGDWADRANAVQQTADGAVLFAGVTYSNEGDVSGNHGLWDAWVAKVDATGVLWQRTYGGSESEEFLDMHLLPDGSRACAGYSSSSNGDVQGNHGGSDGWIVRTDAAGDIVWQRSIGGALSDHASSISPVTSGGWVVAGFGGSTDGDMVGTHGAWDGWVLRTDEAGATTWLKVLGGTDYDVLNAVEQNANGGFIAAGYSPSSDGDLPGNLGDVDGWLLLLDGDGNTVWSRNFGGTDDDRFLSVRATADGGYVAAGTTRSMDGDITGNHGYEDAWVLKVDHRGDIEWSVQLGGSSLDEANAVRQTSDGGYVVVGSTASNNGDVMGVHGDYTDVWVVKLTPAGTIQWQKPLGGSISDQGFGIAQAADGGYLVGADTESNDGDVSGIHDGSDAWIVKLGSDPVGLSEHAPPDISIRPDQSTGRVVISSSIPLDGTVLVCDALGRTIMSERLFGMSHQLDMRRAPQGLYVVSVHTERGSVTQRVVVE